MRDRSPSLASRVRKFVSSVAVEETHSKMVPLGADADVLDGLNPHVVIIDELHAHRTRAVLDVMDSATGARREPLLVMITTAGTDRTSVCWEQHAYAERVLAGTIEDDSLVCYIATIDEGDDWRDELSWRKANPNLGITVKPDYLERRAAKATKVGTEWLSPVALERVDRGCRDMADRRCLGSGAGQRSQSGRLSGSSGLAGGRSFEQARFDSADGRGREL
jgi:phage terminase large subunit-like protein